MNDSNGLKKYLKAVVIAMILQAGSVLLAAGSVIWWASNLSTRVQYVEKTQDGLSARVHDLETTP